MRVNNMRWLNVVLSVVVVFAAGPFVSGCTSGGEHAGHEHASAESVWTCSMHPHVRSPEPGECPICGMDLIPLASDTDASDADAMQDGIHMSATAMKLADVQTAAVSKAAPVRDLRLSGKVQVDERRQRTQSAHIPGRIESLAVDFTGAVVTPGQVLARVYSPELISAQEEVFESRKIKDAEPALFEAALHKLANWKLSQAQIAGILEKGTVQETFAIRADIAGVVDEKLVNPGDYVKTGQPMYRITDLSRLWVLLDVYESDMAWVREGDAVTYTVNALPGETFKGTIAYIDPMIDAGTRVARARIEVDNPDLRLKPDMFVSGTVSSRQDTAGVQLVVPKTAVMWTGKRSVVYVKVAADDGVYFKMREVALGPDLGESYIIESGLDVGEEIAVHGTFSVDAAAQLAGKPSMMNPGKDSGSMNMKMQEMHHHDH